MRLLSSAGIVLAIVLAACTSAFATDAETLPGQETGQRTIAQQCVKDLQAFDQELAGVGFGVLPSGGVTAQSGSYVWGVEGTPRQKLRAWWDAAYLYALDGDEQSCQRILASMRSFYQGHQKLIGNESDDLNVKTAWRRAHLARATPIIAMDHLMRAKILIGSEIRNLKDDWLGKVEDIVLNPDKRDIRYILVSRGGFLGIGKTWVAVRWNDLRATEDHELYVLDVAPTVLDGAPTVDRRTFAKTADADWQRSLDQYWDRVLK
jgi:sporulation protein YlmC with PRC-barrel domain